LARDRSGEERNYPGGGALPGYDNKPNQAGADEHIGKKKKNWRRSCKRQEGKCAAIKIVLNGNSRSGKPENRKAGLKKKETVNSGKKRRGIKNEGTVFKNARG